MSVNLEKLSKIVSHALRHEPQSYNLELDEEGWANLSDLISSLHNRGWENLQEGDLIIMIEKNQKRRHEILNGRIRAFYGHSLPEKIIKQQQVPPDILFHGTSLVNIESILKLGLSPMDRQFVHLSEKKSLAETVAKRRKGETKVLTIMAKEAWNNGVNFYKEKNEIWLSEPIPSKFIQL